MRISAGKWACKQNPPPPSSLPPSLRIPSITFTQDKPIRTHIHTFTYLMSEVILGTSGLTTMVSESPGGGGGGGGGEREKKNKIWGECWNG